MQVRKIKKSRIPVARDTVPNRMGVKRMLKLKNAIWMPITDCKTSRP